MRRQITRCRVPPDRDTCNSPSVLLFYGLLRAHHHISAGGGWIINGPRHRARPAFDLVPARTGSPIPLRGTVPWPPEGSTTVFKMGTAMHAPCPAATNSWTPLNLGFRTTISPGASPALAVPLRPPRQNGAPRESADVLRNRRRKSAPASTPRGTSECAKASRLSQLCPRPGSDEQVLGTIARKQIPFGQGAADIASLFAASQRVKYFFCNVLFLQWGGLA